MSRFKYVVVASTWGTGGTVYKSQLSSVTVHHSAVKASTDKNYSAERRAKSYAVAHRRRGYPGIAYHIFIPYDDSDNIYITNYLNGHTWHNGNAAGNRDALAVLVDGNFEEEKPSVRQILKLKQVLDDLYSNWFSKNGWYPVDKPMNPRDSVIHRYTAGKNVRTLHYHNEVAQPGHGTACCGKNLIPYVLEYRNNKGSVTWDKKENMEHKKLQEKIDSLSKQLKEKGDEISGLKKLNKELQNNVVDLNTKIVALKEAEDLAARALSESNQTRSKLLKRNDELIKEVARLNTELGNMPIKEEPVQDKTFADMWEKLPTWAKYILPNVAAVLIPGLITLVTDLDIQDPEVLAGLGISVATIKSLIVGYLKRAQKTLEENK